LNCCALSEPLVDSIYRGGIDKKSRAIHTEKTMQKKKRGFPEVTYLMKLSVKVKVYIFVGFLHNSD